MICPVSLNSKQHRFDKLGSSSKREKQGGPSIDSRGEFINQRIQSLILSLEEIRGTPKNFTGKSPFGICYISLNQAITSVLQFAKKTELLLVLGVKPLASEN